MRPLRALVAAALAAALGAGCAGRAERTIDEDAFRRPFGEPGEGHEMRLAVPPPANRTPLKEVGPWAAEALEEALGELSAYRVKGPSAIRPLLDQTPVGEAYERFAAHPDDAEVMVAAAMAIGRAAPADFVLMHTVDVLAKDGPGYGGFLAVLAAYRTHLVHVQSGKVVWSQGYSTRVEPRTDEAEPAIRWALLQTQRDLVARIPWRKDK